MTSKWPSMTLDDVARIDYGTRVTRKRDGGSKYPVYGGGGATFNLDDWNREDCYIVSRFAMSEECVRRVNGRFFLNDSGLTLSTLDTNRLSQEFLDRFLFTKSAEIYDLSRGAAQRNLDVPAFRNLQIPLPPLDEQKRIVAKLDEALKLAGEESMRVSTQLNELAILRTEILREIFNPNEIGTGEVTLGEVAERVVVGFVGTTSPHYRESGIPFLRTQNVTRTGLRLDELNYITPEFHAASKKSQIKKGDVLLSRVITDSVNVGLVPAELGEANCANVVIVTPGQNLIPEYLVAFVGSPASQQYLLSRKVGSAQVVVNTGTVKEWPIPVPSIEEQKEIISKLKSIELEIDLVKKKLQLKHAYLSDFRRSVLTSAFAGAL